MSSILEELYPVDYVRTLMRDVDSVALESTVSGSKVDFEENTIPKLEISAYIQIHELLSQIDISKYITHSVNEESNIGTPSFRENLFLTWDSYIEGCIHGGEALSLESILYYTVAGLYSEHPTEVRYVLSSEVVENSIQKNISSNDNEDWGQRVRRYISASLIFLIRQSSPSDISAAGVTIEKLSSAQNEFEDKWLSSKSDNTQRAAASLLSLYHIARAVIRTSEFLLAGSVPSSESDIRERNFLPELSRLVDRADEYSNSTYDDELIFLTKASGLILVALYKNSIWANAYGTSDLLDRFLSEFPNSNNPIFSLLPSQREALRKHLLDSAKLAMVLQMPTSAGKTLLAEFSIIQAIEAYGLNSRIVYVTPTRALATQVKRTLLSDLGPLGIPVHSAGSAFEEDPYELNILEAATGVIVATPEKLDLLLRTHPEWLHTLRLVVVDEAHLLRESGRGAKLELLIANLRKERPEARLLLLSPFVDNAHEIAAWLAGDRGAEVTVHWRPSRVLLGLANIVKGESGNHISIEWTEPYGNNPPKDTAVAKGKNIKKASTATQRANYLAEDLLPLGSCLVMFPSSPKSAEKAAFLAAEPKPIIHDIETSAELRVAIALAKAEYGDDSALAKCLSKGVAFHHSALSPELRFLIEDLAKRKIINQIFATTTLAQGMNFPVASVIVHSLHKPNGLGDLTPGEFWNIAGRAGRVGMADRGLVVFANQKHKTKLQRYAEHLSEPLHSALLGIINLAKKETSLKEAYRKYPQLRALIQYLAHSAANLGTANAISELEELLHASLAHYMADSATERRALRDISLSYLKSISDKPKSYLKAADSTGLGSFSFDELYAKIQGSPILLEGPKGVSSRQQDGLTELISALAWLPELDLAIGKGNGQMDVEAVGRVVHAWINGASIHDLSSEFPGYQTDTKEAVRKAGSYINSTVSQMISWGTHAYIRSWRLSGDHKELSPEEMMLPAYIQYGVNTPEAAVASHLGVPRLLSEAFASVFRESHGNISPEKTNIFKSYLEQSDINIWDSVVQRSKLKDYASHEDIYNVWKYMSGLS